MTLHLHHFTGCAPAPLANYLKALGILRLVAEQADANARGWWQDEHFCLLTKLSKQELESFFLEKYEPTPLLSPWNGGSGFFRTWDAKNGRLRKSKNAAALEELLDSDNLRLQRLRLAVEEIREVLPVHCEQTDVSCLTTKERNKLLILPSGDGPVFPVIPKDDSGKLQVQRALLRTSRTTPFYSSALVEVDGEVKTPWLWGSGGNDGNIDYSGRYFENLKLVLLPVSTDVNLKLLENAFWQQPSTGILSGAAGKVGQFLPYAAGGPNITTGTGSQSDTYLNPWDFVLALEGAVIFSSRASRRLDPNAMSRATAPFAVRSHAAGHASAGNEKSDRGEQWMPLWSRPTTLGEFAALIGEARIQLGRQSANRPVDVVRAINRLGAVRGITAFTRYGYLERNGQSRLAVPLGRIQVRQHPQAFLIEDIAPWLDRLQRRTRDKNATARLVQAERRLTDAVLAALTHDPSAERWQAILVAAVAVESLQASGTAIEAGPMPLLRPEWIRATDDGTAEFRLAVALGGAANDYSREVRAFDSVRSHWLPLDPKTRRFKTSDKRLINDPRVVISGRDPLADCAAIVERRLIEATSKGQRHLPLVAARGCGAKFGDLAEFLSGSLDVQKIIDLARAFMAIRWDQCGSTLRVESQSRRGASRHNANDQPDEAWLALRLACLPWPLDDGRNIPTEPAIVRRLISGDVASATDIAIRRLRAAGIRPPLKAATADQHIAQLWAAALVFPIDRVSAQRAAAILDPSLKGPVHA